MRALQIRGSIPLYWVQDTASVSPINPKPAIQLQQYDPHYSATRLHFQVGLLRSVQSLRLSSCPGERWETVNAAIVPGHACYLLGVNSCRGARISCFLRVDIVCHTILSLPASILGLVHTSCHLALELYKRAWQQSFTKPNCWRHTGWRHGALRGDLYS